jgi:MurNAc alpha-1-phosphate uridylyltransferase
LQAQFFSQLLVMSLIATVYLNFWHTKLLPLFDSVNRSQTQDCYNIVKRCLKLTHVLFFLASLPTRFHLMDVIILAAGHGTRLRPLTDRLPKPLIEVDGLSLIEVHLYRLAFAGYTRVIINLHHLGEAIKSKLSNGKRYGLNIVYSEETNEALETAGGIINALDLIQSERFVAISADVVCDYPVELLATASKNEAQGNLIMVENPAHHPGGDFSLNSSNYLIMRNQSPHQSAYTFSGLACFHRALFEHLQPGKRALRPVLEAAIAKQQIKGEVYTGLWLDIGTLERLDQARDSAEVCEYIDSIRQSIS